MGLAASVDATAQPWRDDPVVATIDRQVWHAIVDAGAQHDIAAMGQVYHPDAVLVNRAGPSPIAQALVRWGRDMETAKKTGGTATVELRFTSRQHDDTTAFEVGAFRYATTDGAGKSAVSFTTFEALLVKRDGRWLVLMERQKDPIGEREFLALPR